MDLPIGTIIAFAGAELNEEWLLCDGQQCSGLLARLIGNNVPDLRGQFLRGFDPNGIVDPDGQKRQLLSQQADEIASHNHKYSIEAWGADSSNPKYEGGSNVLPEPTWGALTESTGGEETRPKNVAVNYFIYAGSQT